MLVLAGGSVLVSQLGKLRHFGAGWGADLAERLDCGLCRLGCFHRGSPLFPALSGAVVVRPVVGDVCVGGLVRRRRRCQRSDSSPVTTEAAAMPAQVGQLLRSSMIMPKSRNATVARPHQTRNPATVEIHALLPLTGEE